MSLIDQIDEILYRSFRWMTVPEIHGAMRAMFGPCPGQDVLRTALDAEPSFRRYGDQYCVSLTKRDDRLETKLGLAD